MQTPKHLCQPVDIQREWYNEQNTFFHLTQLKDFDPGAGAGTLVWNRHAKKPRLSFNQVTAPYEPQASWSFPPDYGNRLETPFQVSLYRNQMLRIRMDTRRNGSNGDPIDSSLMIQKRPEPETVPFVDGEARLAGLTVKLKEDPFALEIRHEGHLVTRLVTLADSTSLQNHSAIPCSIVRSPADLSGAISASFALAPDEKIFGCGESFTRLNKRGQKVVLYTSDPLSVQTQAMYKPVPFFYSSRGYGMFVHTSSPTTMDFGHTYDEVTTVSTADTCLDLFLFVGDAKLVLKTYTGLTGRATMPPVWSFGLWMSRITYKSQDEVMEVARSLRQHQIPCDVIHLDTGWFEQDWRCDYRFSPTRFPNPEQMIQELKAMGFRLSLWQLPYLTPQNPLFREAVEEGYVVMEQDGDLAVEDAVIDFSNPAAVQWYQRLLARLLRLGVSAIKADFGEAAPLHGRYHSGRSGRYEHNLYPLRYNQAVYDVTKQELNEAIIWGRSAWAGGQRYPVMWGGDAENTDSAMAASLRAGLSLGVCGFSFWSHDIGGFVQSPSEELYRRWLPFGMLTSHSRCHGAPPKEPWAYGQDFTDYFREVVQMKYRLLPYILEQARLCCEQGLPMVRPLFFEYPNERAAYEVEDQYLFGAELLVAPAFSAAQGRNVYLPAGDWVDYLTGQSYYGGQDVYVPYGRIPIVVMRPAGCELPEAEPKDSTDKMALDQDSVCTSAAGCSDEER